MSRIEKPIASVAVLLCTVVFSGPLYAWTKTLTFESGTVGQVANGSDAFDDAGSQVLYSNTRAKSGSQSAAVTMGSCTSFWPTHTAEYPADSVSYGGRLWARMWVFLQSGWSWAGCDPGQADRIKWIRFTTSAGSISVLLSQNGYIRPSNEPYGASGYEEPVFANSYNEVSPSVSEGTVPANQWVELELYVYFHETAGVVRIWKDGILVFQDTNVKTVPNGVGLSYTQYWGTWNQNPYVLGSGTSQTFWVDDLTLQTDVPDNVDAYGNRMISTGGGGGGGDTTPPVISSGSPSGTLTCAVDPRDVTISVATNEPAACRMATSDIAYDSMTDIFASTGGYSHSETKQLSCGSYYTYYIRCADAADNKNTTSYTVSFTISSYSMPSTRSILFGTPIGEGPYTKGLVVQDNTPSSGFVSFGSFQIYYDGDYYSMPYGAENMKYMCWRDFEESLLWYSYDPREDPGWDENNDFVILINDGGTATLLLDEIEQKPDVALTGGSRNITWSAP